MIKKENLVYIPLPVAKLLADKNREINNLQEENMNLECKIMSLEEELDYLKIEPIDPYDAFVDWSDFY
ncbi:MAG: hypothetical protein HFI08_02055 [Bacilli bacterium]|jgi:cell division protein FtsB|nr:hypothetical protein [Bacilli bacterium]